MSYKKVLIISCFFPPYGGGGIQRAVKFVKFLPRFGWMPLVLTINRLDLMETQDETLLRDIPSKAKIFRTKTLQIRPTNKYLRLLFSAISIPDPSIWWLPYAISVAKKIWRNEKYHAIYATGGPFSNLVIGLLLSKIQHLPLIIDLRDPWVLDPAYKKYKWILHYWIQYWLYIICLKNAGKIIVATEGMKEQIDSQFNKQYKVSVITNGFDNDDFRNLPKFSKKKNIFTICHIGTFSGTRKPDEFLEAMQQIKKHSPRIYNRIRVYFIGQTPEIVHDAQKRIGITDNIYIKKYVPHIKALGYMKMADCLLLIVNNIPENFAIDTGKVFEYIAFKKRVLAISNRQSGAAKILHSTKLGVITGSYKPEIIKRSIIRLYREWIDCKPIIYNKQQIEKYHRIAGANKLASILDNIH